MEPNSSFLLTIKRRGQAWATSQLILLPRRSLAVNFLPVPKVPEHCCSFARAMRFQLPSKHAEALLHGFL